MGREIRLEDVQKLLAKRCAEAGGQRAFARVLGINVGYLHKVLTGKSPPSERMCKAIGVREVGIIYERD